MSKKTCIAPLYFVRLYTRAGKNLWYFKENFRFLGFLCILGFNVRTVARGALGTGLPSRRRPVHEDQGCRDRDFRKAVSRSPKVGLPISEKLGIRHSDSESAKLGVRMSDSQSI